MRPLYVTVRREQFVKATTENFLGPTKHLSEQVLASLPLLQCRRIVQVILDSSSNCAHTRGFQDAQPLLYMTCHVTCRVYRFLTHALSTGSHILGRLQKLSYLQKISAVSKSTVAAYNDHVQNNADSLESLDR